MRAASCKLRQCPALCFVGDDACIVPETLQRRKPHAAGEIARPTKPRKRAVTQKVAAICQPRQRADDFIGPYAEGRSGRSVRKAARRRGTVCRPRLCRPFALHCRAGVHARRGALRQPGRVLARQGAAPLSRLTPPAPLTGEPSGWQALYKASPARGGVTEGDGGVHCRLASQVSCKARQSLARHP